MFKPLNQSEEEQDKRHRGDFKNNHQMIHLLKAFFRCFVMEQVLCNKSPDPTAQKFKHVQVFFRDTPTVDPRRKFVNTIGKNSRQVDAGNIKDQKNQKSFVG